MMNHLLPTRVLCESHSSTGLIVYILTLRPVFTTRQNTNKMKSHIWIKDMLALLFCPTETGEFLLLKQS